MDVIYTASRNLYPYLPGVYRSLLDHNPKARVWLFIEDDQLPYETPKQVRVVNVSGQKFFGPKCPNIKTNFTYLAMIRATYALLFTGKANNYGIPKLPKLDKILQLDVDTIVCENLKPLWDVDMTGKWMFAVKEANSDWKPFGGKIYYNAGVVLFNLEQMREDNVCYELIEYLNTRKALYIDQDAINYALHLHGYDKCLNMGSRYNETLFTGQSLSPAIVHYAGEKKWYENFEEVYRGAYIEKYSKYFELDACRVEVRA